MRACVRAFVWVRVYVRACVGTISLTIINMFACTRFHLISSKPAARLLCRLSSWWVKKNVVQHNTTTRVYNCTHPHTTRTGKWDHMCHWDSAQNPPFHSELQLALHPSHYLPLWLPWDTCFWHAPFAMCVHSADAINKARYCCSVPPPHRHRKVAECALSLRFVLSAPSVLVNSLSGYWHNFLVNWCT